MVVGSASHTQNSASCATEYPYSYDRVIFSDADIVFIAPPDGLLTVPTPAAYCHFFNNNFYKPSSTLINAYGGRLEHGAKITVSTLQKVYDGPPKPGFRWFVPSASILVITAGQLHFSDYLAMMSSKPRPYSYPWIANGGDEQSFCEFCLSQKLDMYHIGFEYNAVIWHMNMMKPGLKPIGYHLFGSLKPWYMLPESGVKLSEEQIKKIKSYPDTQLWMDIYTAKKTE